MELYLYYWLNDDFYLKSNKKPRMNAWQRWQKIDELLDTRNDYKALYEMFGDETYQKMIDQIDKELIKLNQ